MRHNRDEKRFDMNVGHLRAVMANMTNDLVLAGRIRTTTPRAKLLRRYAERMITLGKDGSVHARRRAFAFMRNKIAVTRLFDAVAPQYTERKGGYTRIIKLGARPGDNAHMSFIELVGSPQEAKAVGTKPAKKVSKPAPKKTTVKASAGTEAKAAAKKTEKKAAGEAKTVKKKKAEA
ncbi:MAG: 50S ribosomal protein L17 [Deltaproteobacteria bacterium]|nr:50S ribosomal protein L17 [Deltaproteobacteria bacterium]